MRFLNFLFENSDAKGPTRRNLCVLLTQYTNT